MSKTEIFTIDPESIIDMYRELIDDKELSADDVCDLQSLVNNLNAIDVLLPDIGFGRFLQTMTHIQENVEELYNASED